MTHNEVANWHSDGSRLFEKQFSTNERQLTDGGARENEEFSHYWDCMGIRSLWRASFRVSFSPGGRESCRRQCSPGSDRTPRRLNTHR